MKSLFKKISLALCSLAVIAPLYTAEASIYDIHANMQAAAQERNSNNAPVKVSTVPSDHAYIPKGTVITVELKKELKFDKDFDTKAGEQTVLMTLKDNIVINYVIVVPAGSEVKGHIVQQDFKNYNKGKIKMAFTIDSVETINHVAVPLKYHNENDLYDDNEEAGLVVGKFTKSGDTLYPAHSYYTAEVVADTDLNVTLKELKFEMAR